MFAVTLIFAALLIVTIIVNHGLRSSLKYARWRLHYQDRDCRFWKSVADDYRPYYRVRQWLNDQARHS